MTKEARSGDEPQAHNTSEEGGRDELRDRVESRLRSYGMVKSGLLGGTMMLDVETGEFSSHVDRSNVEEASRALAEQFGEVYPDLFPDAQATEA